MKKKLWMYYTYSIKDNVILVNEVLFDFNETPENVVTRAIDDYYAVLYSLQDEDNVDIHNDMELVQHEKSYIKTKDGIEYYFLIKSFSTYSYNEQLHGAYIIRCKNDNDIDYLPYAFGNYVDAEKYYKEYLSNEYFENTSSSTNENLHYIKMFPSEDGEPHDFIQTRYNVFEYELLVITAESYYDPINFE